MNQASNTSDFINRDKILFNLGHTSTNTDLTSLDSDSDDQDDDDHSNSMQQNELFSLLDAFLERAGKKMDDFSGNFLNSS